MSEAKGRLVDLRDRYIFFTVILGHCKKKYGRQARVKKTGRLRCEQDKKAKGYLEPQALSRGEENERK